MGSVPISIDREYTIQDSEGDSTHCPTSHNVRLTPDELSALVGGCAEGMDRVKPLNSVVRAVKIFAGEAEGSRIYFIKIVCAYYSANKIDFEKNLQVCADDKAPEELRIAVADIFAETLIEAARDHIRQHNRAAARWRRILP